MSYKKPATSIGFTSTHKRCCESHPALPITIEGKNYFVYGGSCSKPIHLDADIYVGLDTSMKLTEKEYPWSAGHEIGFFIQDMGTPKDTVEFKKLIEWLSVQLIANQKIHIGCIGGHGRTGLVLAALYKNVTNDKEAVTYVRDNYCKKAVESQKQIEYLHEEFGINKVKATKDYSFYDSDFGKNNVSAIPTKQFSSTFEVDCMQSSLSIW